MKVALTFATAALAGLVLSGLVWTASADRVYEFHFDGVMGTSLDVRVQARSEAAAHAAEAVVGIHTGPRWLPAPPTLSHPWGRYAGAISGDGFAFAIFLIAA